MNAWWYPQVLGVVAIIGTLLALWLVLQREQVKKDLRQKGLKPLHVRWRPFAYWAMPRTTGFKVLCTDPATTVHALHCWVSDLDLRVRWIDDTGYLVRLPAVGQVIYSLLSFALLAFGLGCLATGELVLPPTLRHPSPVRLSGRPLTLLAIAALFGAAQMLVVVVAQYTSGKTKRFHEMLARCLSLAGWGSFLASLVLYTLGHF